MSRRTITASATAALAILIVGCFAAKVFWRPWYIAEVSDFVSYMENNGDPELIRAWAVEEISITESGKRPWRCLSFDIHRDELPEPIRELYEEGPVGAYANRKFATLVWGNGIGEMGLFVGPQDWQCGGSSSRRYVKQWVPGIYAFRIKRKIQDVSYPVLQPSEPINKTGVEQENAPDFVPQPVI